MYALILAFLVNGAPAPYLLDTYPVFKTLDECQSAAPVMGPSAKQYFLKQNPDFANKEITVAFGCPQVIPLNLGAPA